MRFRDAAVVPPMVLLSAPKMRMPVAEPLSPVSPLALVPI